MDNMDRKKTFQIVNETVENYVRSSIKGYDGILGEIYDEAVKLDVPVINLETARLLEIIVKIKHPKRILEIGTAVGFTSVIMAGGLADGGKIDTIEIEAEIAQIAAENFSRAGITKNINLIIGDAADVLVNMKKTYDFIFIDAAKGQYGRYYELCSEMVAKGGIVFADNVLYRGMTAGGAKINRRQQLLVNRLREFIKTAVADEKFITDILSLGDGICISYKI